MKRLVLLCLLVLTAPCALAGVALPNTIITNLDPPYLVPPLGTPVTVGGSETASVVLTKVGGPTSRITVIGLLPGSDFTITGGTCVQNVTNLVNPGDSCSIDVRFSPTAAGARVGTLTVDCSPLPAVGGITITCDFDDTTIANIALNGLGAILAAVSVSVPTIGRYEMTALAMLLFALAAWSLRRKP